MQTENKLFDDFARLAGGALSALTGVKTELEGLVRQQLEQFLGTLHLVSREEFDAVQAMAAKAREDQEIMAERLAALEAELTALKGGAAAPARKAKGADEKA